MHSIVPVENWKQRRRHGMVMSRTQMRILQALRAAEKADEPWVYLDRLHKRTLKSLLRFGWVYCSLANELDRERYRITSAGLKALKIFETPPRRFDGLCPVCGVRPKHVSVNGRVWGYCQPCDNASKRRARALKRPRLNPNCPCSDCGGPLYVTSTGEVTTWCKACRSKHRKADRARREVRLRARIAAGDIPTCKCGQPLYVTPSRVHDKCERCWMDYQKKYRLTKRGKTGHYAAKA